MVVDITYYGRGYKLIRSNRIVMDDGTKLTEAMVQSKASVQSEEQSNLQEQLDAIFKFVRKQQKIIEMLVDEVEKLQNKG